MKKDKFHIEYVLDKVSKRSLWNHLTTPHGLSSWFAKDVDVNGNIYTFTWDKSEQEKARLIAMKQGVYIRFSWLEENDGSYFEFRIHTVELTGIVALEITDFAEPSEIADTISIWDLQVDELKRTLGV